MVRWNPLSVHQQVFHCRHPRGFDGIMRPACGRIPDWAHAAYSRPKNTVTAVPPEAAEYLVLVTSSWCTEHGGDDRSSTTVCVIRRRIYAAPDKVSA